MNFMDQNPFWEPNSSSQESREDSIPPTVNLTSSQWLLGNENEALATETGWYNPNISNGGNAFHHPEFLEAIVGWSNTELGHHRLVPCEP